MSAATLPQTPADVRAVDEALDAAERDAQALVAGLDETQGTWRPAPGSWSVAECLDHLATSNRVYVDAMTPPAERALAEGRSRRGAIRPDALGRVFIWSLEPPVRIKTPAPPKIQPRPSPPLADAAAAFFASQHAVRSFVHRFADIDLNRVRFPNPFIRGVAFTLATGILVIPAHERRHLWQAWRVRRAMEHG